MPNDSLNREIDFNDLSPKMQGLVASSIKCAALELVEILPDEPKENKMNKILATIARAFTPAPCPLEGIQTTQAQIKSAYENRLGTRQSGILGAGYRSRALALASRTTTVRSIR